MKLRIANLVCEINAENPSWQNYIYQQYQIFTSPRGKADISVTLSSRKELRNILCDFLTPTHISIYTPTSLKLYHRFNFCLKTVIAGCLLDHDGFMLHASSLVINRQAYLFSGKQGVGKSTVVKLFPEYEALNDDFAIVRKVNRKYLVFGSPFPETNKIKQLNHSYPLKSLFFLKQAKENGLEKLEKLECVRLLSSLILNRMSLPDIRGRLDKKSYFEKILATSISIVDNIPCFRLSFTKNRDFINLIGHS